MARVSLQAFRENDKSCTSWSLRSSLLSAEESDLVIRLRKNGFYAGHSNLEELKSFCLQNFNPFRVPSRPDLPITTRSDNEAGVERDNLRSDSQKLDSTVQKIVKSSCIEVKKDVMDKQKNQFDKDLPESKPEVQNPVTTSFCLATSKSKRTESMSSRFGDVPSTILDRSSKAIQRCHTFQDDDVSSGDDAEVVPDFVECFYVTDENDKVISLFVLPYASSTSRENNSLGRFYLHGKYDNGLHPVMRAITMWKLELGQKSYFSVKTLAGNWIRLGQPIKSYAGGQLRTALVVKKLLSYVNLNHHASEKMVWAHLQKEFRFLDFQPSIDDLLQHKEIIKKLAKQIPELDCATIVGDLLKKRKATNHICDDGMGKHRKKNKNCIDVEGIQSKSLLMDQDKEIDMTISSLDNKDLRIDSSEELDDCDAGDVGETVCAICDDGGDILCCDGPCLRSFHATKAATAKSTSRCVSLNFTEYEVKEMSKFFCWNCLYKKHQCFVCGQLGLSEGESKEVFVCDVALCGRFYHLDCVSKLLVSIEEQATFVEQIKTGSEAFSCPLHRCFACKKGDIKENEALRLYGCRRCPRAWHKECISNKLAFYDGEWVPGLRGWEMNGMRFLYCLRHEMDEDLGTPVRNHLVFPNGPSIGFSSYASKKERKLSAGKIAPSSFQQASHTNHGNLSASNRVHNMGLFRRMGTKIFQKPPVAAFKKSSVGINSATPLKTKLFPSFNEEVKRMIESIIDTSKKAVTFDTVVANLSVPIIYKEPIGSMKKNLCLGKLDSILHALMKSRECLLRGASEEARCIFPEESIRILERSKNKLRVYLAPILHGVRYTSYGRHFTKLEKLQEIVNRLHWYVDSGDMVVDFCCGSNDFSRLMVEKLTQCHKNCEYKNFDIIQPKHDFNFTKRDWLSVKKHELPSGDNLIMGLNPPFGVFAQLANTMVQHALTFKPKLLILIVPKETKRLEYSGYECIWEDPCLLSGQAFYFPGSVDLNDKSLSQENFDAPPLYLWSRSDWATRHRHIAAEQGHLETLPLKSSLSHPVPQIWSTRNCETQLESRNRELSHFTDHCSVPPSDYLTSAIDFDPSKVMNASAEHQVRGEFYQQQCEKISAANNPDHGAQIKPQHSQQSESSSHYRKLVESWTKDLSGNQRVPGQELYEMEMVSKRQPEDLALDLDSCKEAPRQYISTFEEGRRAAMGRQYPGCELLVQTRSFISHSPYVPSSRPYHDLQLNNRKSPDLALDGHTGGWIED